MSTTSVIQKLREDAGLTQAEVAMRLGVPRSTYAAIEGGREPKLKVVKILSELYQISPDEIINGKLSQRREDNKIEKLIEIEDIEPENDRPARDSDPKLNPKKLKDVLLYLTEKIGAKPNVGETVIYKLLYFIDMDYYEKTGYSITGMTYINNHFGPTPAKSEFSTVVQQMQRKKELEIVQTKYFGKDQKKYLPLINSQLKSLNANELEHINWEIERLGNKNAAELSELSHYDTPWVVAEANEPIDYTFVYYRGTLTAVTEYEDEL
jgi:transcriptional regulator with XRE-family HTH domain